MHPQDFEKFKRAWGEAHYKAVLKVDYVRPFLHGKPAER